MLKVTDHWTTRDGHWYNSGLEYDIDQEHIDKYPAETIPQAGAATHIMVKAPPDSKVEFKNRYDGKVYKEITVPPSDGFVDMEMQHSSSYVPDRGETGPWTVLVDGQVVKEGVGLPNSWHVSDWNVVSDVEDGNGTGTGPSEPPPPSQPEPGGKHEVAIMSTFNESGVLKSTLIVYSDGSYQDATVLIG